MLKDLTTGSYLGFCHGRPEYMQLICVDFFLSSIVPQQNHKTTFYYIYAKMKLAFVEGGLGS